MMRRSRERMMPEIPAASMADIAFLLLIFFILSSKMQVNKGLSAKLPPYVDSLQQQQILEIQDRNIYTISLTANNEFFFRGEAGRIQFLKTYLKEFISNPEKKSNLSESPEMALVNLEIDPNSAYDNYIGIQNAVREAYNELRDEEAHKRYGKVLSSLDTVKRGEIVRMIPIKISESE